MRPTEVSANDLWIIEGTLGVYTIFILQIVCTTALMTRVHEAGGRRGEKKSGSELLVYFGSTTFLLQTTKVFKLSSIVPGNGRGESVKPQLTLTSIYGNDRTSVG